MYPITKEMRKERRERAEKVQAHRGKRTDEQQLDRLDKMLGKRVGAKRERARLMTRIQVASKNR